jgi:hypothetical protein
MQSDCAGESKSILMMTMQWVRRVGAASKDARGHRMGACVAVDVTGA